VKAKADDIRLVFGCRFGPLDSIFAHKERNFAYVQFREAQDAEVAKNAMSGVVLYGQAIRIEYAKSVR
jgi:RNA recognition motif-containing protein